MQTAEDRQIISPTLQDVKIKFEEWRTNKQNNNTPKAKIPDELWKHSQPLFLLLYHSLSMVKHWRDSILILRFQRLPPQTQLTVTTMLQTS